MPKLKDIDLEELEKMEAEAFACSQMAWKAARLIEQGYCKEVAEPMKLASSYLAASRAFGDLAAAMLMKAALAEQKRKIIEMERAS